MILCLQPKNFISFAFSFGTINLDLLTFVTSEDTCALSLPPLQKFYLQMVLPPSLVLAIVGAFATTLMIDKFRGKPKENTSISSEFYREVSVKTVFGMMLLLYPRLSTSVFSVFRCDQVKGVKDELFLADDYNVVCWSDHHMRGVVVAIIGLFVYVIGFPLGIFVILYRNRSDLWDPESPRHKEIKYELGGLYEQVSFCQTKKNLPGCSFTHRPSHDFFLFYPFRYCSTNINVGGSKLLLF